MRGMRGKGKGMMKEMNLTETQKTKMKEIRTDYRSKMDALEKNDKMTLKDYRSRQAFLQQGMKKDMESVLTPEQKNKMTELKDNRRQEGEARMQKGLERMKTDLSLSDDQYSRMKAGREKMKSQMTAIRENSSLSFDQKKQQIRSLKQTGMEEMKSVLNAEQLKKMDEMKARKRQMPGGRRGMRQGPSSR